MSSSNGVIRIGRKGTKKFAFGEEGTPEGKPFEVDVVVAFQEWVGIDETFRDGNPDRTIKTEDMAEYHRSVREFANKLAGAPEGTSVTTSEALEFINLLNEEYEKLALFFRPRSREKPDSPDTSESALRFSAEAS